MLVLIAWFRVRDAEASWLKAQDILAFVFVAGLYPLAVVHAEMTRLWMQIGCLGMLVYLSLLLLRARLGTGHVPKGGRLQRDNTGASSAGLAAADAGGESFNAAGAGRPVSPTCRPRT